MSIHASFQHQRTSGVDFRGPGLTKFGLIAAFLFICYARWVYLHTSKINNVNGLECA